VTSADVRLNVGFRQMQSYEKKNLVKRLSESATRPAAKPFFL